MAKAVAVAAIPTAADLVEGYLAALEGAAPTVMAELLVPVELQQAHGETDCVEQRLPARLEGAAVVVVAFWCAGSFQLAPRDS